SLTQWPDRPGLWEYKVPLKDIGNDSCIVLYWNPAELAPGVSREVGFSYGLGDVTSKGKLGILNPPPIAVGETFTLVALVADAKPGQSATLELPAGFDLAPDILRTQEVPPSKGGQPSPVTWRVAASSEPGDYLFTVNTSDGMSHSRRVTVRSRGIFQ
ncbi:MAG: hypothetical protein HY040_23420, partial [Planctomycetes bacterium]|nr:hypothetical protein [Planctomycetota bacterium]